MPAPTTSPYDPKPGRRVSLVGIVVVTQVVVALLTASVVYVAWRHLDGNLSAGSSIEHQHAKTIPEQDRDAGHEPLNILVLGTDSRAGTGDAIDGEAGCNCSDTTILVHLSADRRSAYGVSIPRDALVEPVACTRGVEYQDTGLVEWNAAFSAGGAACTAEQLEKDFHVFVDDYVVMDFSGFRNMVSAIGGVNVCIPFVLSDPTHAKVTFQPGKSVHLDGADALSYVRLRYVLAGTDIGRIKRQQVFIRALVDKLVSTGTLTQPFRLYGFADALTKSITTNPELAHVRSLIRLAGEFRDIDLGHIRFVTMPNRIYDAPVGDPFWGRVEILPPAYRLMHLVDQDEPLGVFREGSISGGHSGKPPTAQSKATAAAAGICA